MSTPYSVLGILMLTGISSIFLARCSTHSIRFWRDNCMANFQSSVQIAKSGYDLPPARLIYFIHASNIPLLIALLLTRITHTQMPTPVILDLQSRLVPRDFASKNAYWERKIAYANA